jgi:AcrR family transcriptional regulator
VDTVLRHAGRPRDLRLDETLYRCALEVMLERGYHATTFTEIARRAGVGTPAIYRRWTTKAALGIDIFVREQGTQPIPHSGSLQDDLVEFTRFRLRTWRSPFFHQVALPLLLEAQADRDLGDAIGARFTQYRIPLLKRLGRSIETAELRADVDPNRILDLLMGPITMAVLFGQEVPPETEAESIVDQVLNGLVPAQPKA